ncbi:uncharacterized protein BJ171DRAFT_511092 [Polychytrium aggregatum]|uniref:uncharacterized protein n=1 Tax=Polychytrium aggregatum TaxID=110093 RepID=UPI0022FE0D06|nr:uncharacterized protein BJ171DRAFT_511092 [Polychytrium aggregatum]KAI9203189.1 hypothetical protein BJ171DRAFT_511092 [Polychytrium aggregatum]
MALNSESTPLLVGHAASQAPPSPSYGATAGSASLPGLPSQSSSSDSVVLFVDTSSSSAEEEGFRCWCCWEYHNTPGDPLIRVCLGCRDRDLQYIHQLCINKYLSALPPPRGRTFRALPIPESEQEFVASLVRRDKWYHRLTPSFLLPRFEYVIEGHQCTRCKYPYKVYARRLSPLRGLLGDPYLLAAIVVMTICVGTLTASCVFLIIEFWSDDIIFLNLGFIKIGVVAFAAFMLLFCHSINMATWTMIFEYCGEQWDKYVCGIDESRLIEQMIDQESSEDGLDSFSIDPERGPETPSHVLHLASASGSGDEGPLSTAGQQQPQPQPQPLNRSTSVQVPTDTNAQPSSS